MISLSFQIELVTPSLIKMRFFEILMDILSLSNSKLEQAIFEFVFEKEKQAKEEREKMLKE